jgi:hypothetical protein
MNQSGSHPVAGVTRAREPGRVGSVRPLFGNERSQDRALRGIRVGTASTNQKLRPMRRLGPAPGVNDVNAHRDQLHRQYDRPSLRKFQSVRYGARPHCCYRSALRPIH